MHSQSRTNDRGARFRGGSHHGPPCKTSGPARTTADDRIAERSAGIRRGFGLVELFLEATEGDRIRAAVRQPGPGQFFFDDGTADLVQAIAGGEPARVVEHLDRPGRVELPTPTATCTRLSPPLFPSHPLPCCAGLAISLITVCVRLKRTGIARPKVVHLFCNLREGNA